MSTNGLRRGLWLGASLITITSTACMHRHQAAAAKAAAARVMRRADRLSDANIAAILLAANNTDISYARLAPTHAESKDVKDFAQRMLADHAAVNEWIMTLLNTSHLDPEECVKSLDLRDESATKRDILRELSGRAFDTTYMANEVMYHTKLLWTIDQDLVPSAHSEQMKKLLASVRPAVAAHLAHAQDVRGTVASR